MQSLGFRVRLKIEPQLKALRERILQRDSDEAFYDYQKVNEVIMRNRMIKAAIDTEDHPTETFKKTGSPPGIRSQYKQDRIAPLPIC